MNLKLLCCVKNVDLEIEVYKDEHSMCVILYTFPWCG